MNEAQAKPIKRDDDIEHKVAVEAQQWNFESKDSRVWDSCCLRVEKNMVVYITQAFFSFCILAFCSFMLYEARGDCNKSSPYLSLISFLCGKLLSNILTTK